MLTTVARLVSGRLDADCDVVAVLVRPAAEGATLIVPQEVVALSPVDVPAFLARDKFTGEAGAIASLPTFSEDGVRLVLFVGIGAATAAPLRKSAAALARRARDFARLRVDARDLDGGELATFVEAAQLASYRYTLTSDPKPVVLEDIALLIDGAGGQGRAEAFLQSAGVRARATALARDLANTPSGDKSPASLAAAA